MKMKREQQFMADRPQPSATPGDPLIAAIARLSERFGVPFAPAMLSGLALDGAGRLPLHQLEPALEVLGLNCQPAQAKRLPRRAASYPAVVSLADGEIAIVQELKDGDALTWRLGTGAEQWEPLQAIEAEYSGWFATVFGDPSALREAGQPWEQSARQHWFWSEVTKLRPRFRWVWLATLLANVLALALPLFTMNVYDRVLPNRTEATLWVLAGGVMIAFALDYALRRARSAVLDDLGRELDLKLSQKIFSKILAAPLAERKGHTGNLVARVSEYGIVREFYASTTVVLMVDLVFLVLFVALIAWIAKWLALIPLIAIAVMALIGLRLRTQVIDAAKEAQADHGLQQTLLVESIAGLETLKSVSGEGTMLGRWRRIFELGAHSQQRLKDVNTTAIGLAQTFQQVSNIALIVGGYYLFDAGEITMGAIIAIVMLSSRSLQPAGQLAFLLSRGQQAQQTMDSIQKLWEASDERRMGSASLTPSVRSASIRTEGLDFSYPEASVPSLKNINLTIRPGERIAVIGRVASGKSTLGRVLCGLYQPGGGSVLVDGIDSRQYRPQDLREAFRFVGQDAGLFSGTIKDNLSLGAGVVDDQKLIDALRDAAADQFLSQDAGGFDRGVGEAGSQLSGGQRSFLALARALVRPSKLLFLDEPTGAMDMQSEKLFVERLSQSLTPDQTLIISTHRPALFAICDRLIVLDKGQVVADGPRDEIIKTAGLRT
jgi:ATP-binding cassette subfamily C protein LapB